MSEYTNVQLMEKIIRAKIALEGSRVPCKSSCASEDMTGHPVPCTCGAEAANSRINEALRALKL
jgi:hypothetical protein